MLGAGCLTGCADVLAFCAFAREPLAARTSFGKFAPFFSLQFELSIGLPFHIETNGRLHIVTCIMRIPRGQTPIRQNLARC